MRGITLFVTDLILLYASLLGMLGLRYRNSFSGEYAVHIVPFAIIIAVWLLVFYIANLYDPRTARNSLSFYSEFFRAIVIAATLSISFFYLIPIFGITPKANLALFIVIFAALDTAGRALFNGLVETKFRKMTVLVGRSEQTREVADFIKSNPQLGYELNEIIDPDNIAALTHAVNHRHIDTIVLSPEAYQIPEIINIFYKALARKITFYNLSTFYERLTGRVPLSAINQVWFLENISEGSKRAYEVIKRLGDIIFGALFGTLSLITYPFIIVAIKLSSPGPILYRQARIGQMGQKFNIIKFRTMVHNAEAKTGAVWAADNDSRITSVGRFLRRTRLDEIPQFWSVVQGHLSLVGPRAERPEFHGTLTQEVPFYEERYLIKPGLSGWAQINYPYGASVQDAAEKLQYDLYYIKNRSIILDIGIILKTIRIALLQEGK